jgi:hypothetical protein
MTFVESAGFQIELMRIEIIARRNLLLDDLRKLDRAHASLGHEPIKMHKPRKRAKTAAEQSAKVDAIAARLKR